MTPEEYQRFKNAEKEHLKKLKELKKAVQVLERQKNIQSELEKMSRASDDALQAQSEAVERLALETAHQEARLEVAMDSVESASSSVSDEALEDELRSARAQTLIERLKQSMEDEDEIGADAAVPEAARSAPSKMKETVSANASADAPETNRQKDERTAGGAPANPTTEGRPEKTIGRM